MLVYEGIRQNNICRGKLMDTILIITFLYTAIMELKKKNQDVIEL